MANDTPQSSRPFSSTSVRAVGTHTRLCHLHREIEFECDSSHFRPSSSSLCRQRINKEIKLNKILFKHREKGEKKNKELP